MAYYYFKKKEDVPDPQWKTLCDAVTKAFLKLPKNEPRNTYYQGYPMVICDASGCEVIKKAEQLFLFHWGRFFISFNGDKSLSMDFETFTLTQKGFQNVLTNSCETGDKPYDWFVITVLILVHNLCPGCYNITSYCKDDWTPVLQWLNESLNAEYVLPF